MSKKNKHEDNTDININSDPFEQTEPIEQSDLSENTEILQPEQSIPPAETETHQSITQENVVPMQTNVTPINRAIAAAEKTVVRAPTSNPVVRLLSLTKMYIDLVQPGVKLQENKKKAVDVLSNIASHVLSSNNPDVFEAFYGFMMKNRSIMLSSQTIASSLVKYADKSKIVKITQFYVVFQSLVESKILNTKCTLNIATVRQLLGNDHLADWLITKK